jgi:Rhs element Vgr protein
MASPIKSNMGLPSFTILVGGSDVGAKYGIISIRITKELNRVSRAQFFVSDGDPFEETFEVSSKNIFEPNKIVSIKLGYDQVEKEVFSGIITGQSLRVNNSKSELVVNCMDKAFQMALVRKSQNFAKKKDSDVISQIIGTYGLSKSVKATTFKHPNLVQYNCSDWDFVLSRADANAMVLINEDGKIDIAPPVVSGSAVLDISFGKEVLGFKADMDAQNQLGAVEFQSWDGQTMKLVKGAGSEPSVNAHGDLTGKKISATAKSPKLALNSSAPEESSLLKLWAKSHLQHSRLSKITGFVSFLGNALPKVGKLIKLEGFSPHFNGTAYLTKVIHEFDNGFWKTETGFGLNPKTYTDGEKIEGPDALGLLPPISGTHIGKVKKMDKDPAGEYRVQVDVPFIENSGEGLWARLSHRGFYIIPDIGDEVVLSFINNDPRFAVIIGSLYSKKNKPPFTPEKKNKDKAIVTKNKLKMTFDDDKKSIFIETPGGQKITLDDK